MPTLTYNYIPDSLEDPKTHQITGTVYRPKIPIRLANGHNFNRFLVDCWVDSGADYNLFLAQWGESVGLKIDKGKYSPTYGIGGIKIDTYSHRVKLYIGSIILNTEVCFSDKQSIPLLGREGFFNHFKSVRFIEKDRKIELDY